MAVDAIVIQANTTFRDYSVDGVPSSGPNNPVKADIRALFAAFAAILDGLGAGSGAAYAGFTTQALLFADLNYPANTIGEVLSDSTASNNGLYLKTGASGSGSWTQVSTLTLPGLNVALNTEIARAEAAEALLAPLASPAFTGNPTGPTQSALNNSTRLATTAYADGAIAAEVTARNTAIGVETTRAEAAEALLAPLNSAALTGNPTAPTRTALDNSTHLATTAYADAAVGVEATARTSAIAVETARAEAAEGALTPHVGEFIGDAGGSYALLSAGATALYDATGQVVVGLSIPSGQTGAYSALVMFPLTSPSEIAALAGRTINFTMLFSTTSGFLAAKSGVYAGVMVGVPGSPMGSSVSVAQNGTTLTLVASYAVVGNETAIGCFLEIGPSVSSGVLHTATIQSVTWSVAVDLATSALGAGAATLAAAIREKSAGRSGAGSIWSELMPTIGAIYNSTTFTLDSASGYVNGYSIPAGTLAGGSYIQFFWGVEGSDLPLLSGRTVRIKLLCATSNNFAHWVTPSVYCTALAGNYPATNQITIKNAQTSANTRLIEIQATLTAYMTRLAITMLNGDDTSGHDITTATNDFISVTDIEIEIYSTPSPWLSAADETHRLQENKAIRQAERIAHGPPSLKYSTRALVATSGGNYTTIASAINNVSPGTEIVVAAGLWGTSADPTDENLYLNLDYADIRGVGRSRTTVETYYADSTALATIANNSAMNVWFSSKISAMTVYAKNARYAIHTDSVNNIKNRKVVLEDLHLEHLGNAGAYSYQVGLGVGGNPAGVWASTSAFGYGLSDGDEVICRRCTFIGNGFDAVTGHNWNNFLSPARLRFEDCRFDPQSTAWNSLLFGNTGSRQNDVIELIGNEFNGPIALAASPWNTTAAADQIANKMEFSVVGYRNTPAVYLYYDDGSRALRIDSATTGGSSSITVSGSAVAVLFGSTIAVAGAVGLAGGVYGTWDIGAHLVAGTNITSLGYRLGDCTSAPLYLTVTPDGGSPRTVTFNANYTAQSNATIEAAINTVLGSAATCSEYNINARFRPMLIDEELTLTNNDTTTILPGWAVKFDGATRSGGKLMTQTDPASVFAGISYETIPPGAIGRVKIAGMVRQTQDMVRSDAGSFSQGTPFGVGATAGQFVVNPEIPLMIAVSAVDIAFQPEFSQVSAYLASLPTTSPGTGALYWNGGVLTKA